MQNKRQSGNVTRWHTIPTIKSQTVAEHSWGVAMICRQLWPDNYTLIEAALCHDLGEGFTGDVPWPAKMSNERFKLELEEMELLYLKRLDCNVWLNTVDREKLKIADMLEVLYFALEEINMGNQNFKDIFNRGYNCLDMIVDKPFGVLNELIDLNNRYKELTNAS